MVTDGDFRWLTLTYGDGQWLTVTDSDLQWLAVTDGDWLEKSDFQSSLIQTLPRHGFLFMQTKPSLFFTWFYLLVLIPEWSFVPVACLVLSIVFYPFYVYWSLFPFHIEIEHLYRLLRCIHSHCGHWDFSTDTDWHWLTLTDGYWRRLKVTEGDWLRLTVIESNWQWLTVTDSDWRWLTVTKRDWQGLTGTNSG